MKKLLSLLLMVCLLVAPAYAEEIPDQPVEDSLKEDQVVVATIDELQAAMDSAEDGDIIYISQTICMNYEHNSLVCDSDVTLARAKNFKECMIYFYGGGIISGLTFMEETDKSDENTVTVCIDNSWSLPAIIQDCNFIGDSTFAGNYITVFGGWPQDNIVQIVDCSFTSSGRSAISVRANVDISVTHCIFTQNKTFRQGGAIDNTGKMLLENCKIYANSAFSGGGVFNSGIMTISDCSIYGNTIERNTIENLPYGTDIFSTGELTITYAPSDGMSLYNEETAEKMILPIENHTDFITLICLTDEQAIEYFTPTPPQDGETDLPTPGEDSDNKDNTSDLPQEPTDPPQDDAENNPVDNLPQETPKDTEQGNDPVDDVGTTPETPQQPQQPNTNESNDDTTPPIDYRPTQRPTRPTVTVQTDTDTQAQPELTPAPAPALVCNGAVIDTSKTVVLLGYGDGLAHENDPLTRAQLATIIYRLLDDETIARYSGMGSEFTDVSADAWYTPYVRVIGAAGIVNGVGGGRYDPSGLVTWAQIITILSRFVEPQSYEPQHIQYDGWAAQAIQTAVALDWIADSATLNPDAIISRGELVQLVNGVLAMYQ